ncbi:MAG: SUMF1/EgtB/PvdO family nonheme iron enzyme [Armatimonadetes bacterium]|nr:SUMF1/EgtB/PvdO family nonheme iron enzyme [Armatimonadota bacterium]MDE2207257.1 SUMF1/EgtB/PvdO family nonheme iron enzyme [Armatimonadota bacterium]
MKQMDTSVRVSVVTEPPGAAVSLDGVPAGVTPAEIPVELGLHATWQAQVAVTLFGFQPVLYRVTLARGHSTIIPPDVLHEETGAQPGLPAGRAGGPPVEDSGLAAGAVRTNPKDGAEMVWIPPGPFQMGDSDQYGNQPHTVTLSGFWMYRNNVTVTEYRTFCDAAGRRMPPAPQFDPTWSQGDHPIVNVTWDDAAAYAKWAGCELPTEAQGEKAARGTDGRKYPWGSDWDSSKLWCSKSRFGDAGGTTAVGHYGVSPYGCSDMAGNVFDWCRDWYHEAFWSGRAGEQPDPVDLAPGQERVIRGGTWKMNDPVGFRASYRYISAPALSFDYIGFRCALRAGSPLDTGVRLSVVTEPPGAAISLDDVHAGVTPAEIPVDLAVQATRQAQVAITLPGFQRVLYRVTLERGHSTIIPPVALRRETGAQPGSPAAGGGSPSVEVHGLAKGAVRSNPKDGAEMVWIPPGPFQMGDSDIADNSPHSVTLSGFWMYKNDVTVQEYRGFCRATGRQMPPAPSFDPNWSQGDHPIVNLTWDDAAAYAMWAGCELPTEAQWEKAVRGTDGRRYPWGNDWDISKLWCSKFQGGDAGGTTAVGDYGVSPYGCSDMAGNVLDWCRDWYHEAFWSGRAGKEPDPVDLAPGQYRVLRGGSWDLNERVSFRASVRNGNCPANGNNCTGFRCALRAGSPLDTSVRLSAVTEPPGAAVSLDRVPTGVTPAEIPVDLGRQATRQAQVAINLTGFQPVLYPVTLERGHSTIIPPVMLRDEARARPGSPTGGGGGPPVEGSGLAAGKVRTNPKDGAEMVWIPAGPFQMGDSGQRDNPPHTVTLSGFWMYRNDVTVTEYRTFCDAAGRRMPPAPYFDPTWSQGDHPIVNVTWDDAAAYARWAGCELPTEAQWEKAARGTDGRKYPWGSDFDSSKLWCSRRGTTAVGHYGMSPYGCSDMAGNVADWCRDWYHQAFWSGRAGEQPDPVDLAPGWGRVVRGGSWGSGAPLYFRAAHRNGNGPAYSNASIGFRCALRAGSP